MVLTVGELRRLLADFDEDAVVQLANSYSKVRKHVTHLSASIVIGEDEQPIYTFQRGEDYHE
jgi:hypothetical protein